MCGIVGYVGPRQAAPILLAGLEKLEYRGYDSAGLAVINDGKLQVAKAKGRLQTLIDQTENGRHPAGSIGIGHTRWATHGEPSDTNSHPHLSQSGRFAVVHNGIIENYQALQTWLADKGFHIVSETDSEVIAHLIEYYAERSDDDLIDVLIKTIGRLDGSFALGVLDTKRPDRFLAVRKASPLIVGIGSGENYIASDIPALLPLTRDVYLVDDNEIAEITAAHIQLFNLDQEPIEKDVYHIDWDVSAAEKGGYEHFMMKEMAEQPRVLGETVRSYVHGGQIAFGLAEFSAAELKALRHIHVVACGSAYHAGVYAKYELERLTGIPVNVDIASEFRYRNPLVGPDDLVIVISQSGETADTLEALKESRRKGARVLAILNVIGSSMAREADDIIYTIAGPEIAVATTKAFVCQVTVITMLAHHFAYLLGRLSDREMADCCDELLQLPALAEHVLQDMSLYQEMASRLYNQTDMYFIGRSSDFAMSLEASLKLKEISYIHSEACPAGELKHGPISLIEKNTLVVAMSTEARLAEKMKSNIAEVKTRGAHTMVVTTRALQSLFQGVADDIVLLPDARPSQLPVLSVIPMQLFAYYVAVLNGRDVDKPRNLAKSVTVE